MDARASNEMPFVRDLRQTPTAMTANAMGLSLALKGQTQDTKILRACCWPMPMRLSPVNELAFSQRSMAAGLRDLARAEVLAQAHAALQSHHVKTDDPCHVTRRQGKLSPNRGLEAFADLAL